MYADTGYQDRPAWRVICRTINDEGVLADSIMTWYEDPTVAKYPSASGHLLLLIISELAS